MATMLPQATGLPPPGLEQYVKQAQSLITPTNPSQELIAAMTQNSRQRSVNLPLAMGAMLSGDKGMQGLGGLLFKDSNDARNLIPLGDEGFIDPATGQFVASPIGEGKRKEKILEKALQLSQSAQDSFYRQQAAQAQRDFTNQIAIANLYNSNIQTQLSQFKTGNTVGNEGPNPSQGQRGQGPVIPPVANPQPGVSLPLATAQVGAPRPTVPGTVLPQATGAAQAPVIQGQVPPPVVNQAVPDAQGQAPVVNQAAPVVNQEQPPTKTFDGHNLIDSIGQNAPRIGKASNGRGDVYSAPGGGEYILDPETQRYYIRPADVAVIKDRVTLPAERIDEMSAASSSIEKLARLSGTFKPEYGGAKLGIIGEAQNAAGRTFSGSRYAGQAEWWQDWNTYFNSMIKALSGSSVTKGEADRIAATAISPGMDPAFIQKRVVQIQNDAANAFNKLHNHYGGSGFTVDGFKEAIPVTAGQGSGYSGMTISPRQ
jgi:hypothetical protein